MSLQLLLHTIGQANKVCGVSSYGTREGERDEWNRGEHRFYYFSAKPGVSNQLTKSLRQYSCMSNAEVEPRTLCSGRAWLTTTVQIARPLRHWGIPQTKTVILESTQYGTILCYGWYLESEMDKAGRIPDNTTITSRFTGILGALLRLLFKVSG